MNFVKSVRRLFFVTLLVTASALAGAAEPADSQIAGALADIARFEQQAAGLTPARKSNANRILRLMGLTRERLDSSANQSHASWQEADQRYKALKSRLQGLVAGNAAAASAPATASSSPSQPASAAPSAPAQPAGGGGKELVSGQRVQVKKLARDIANTRNDMVTSGPSPMQDGRVVGRYNERLQLFANALGRYADFNQDPDITAAATEYQALVESIKQEYARAQAQLAETGDAQAKLGELDANLRANEAPGQILFPFNDAAAGQWVTQLRNTQAAANAVIAEIQRLAPNAYYPDDATYNRQGVDRLARWAQENQQRVNQAVSSTEQHIKTNFDAAGQHELPFLRELDPDNEHQRANMFLREGADAEVYERLDKQNELANSYAALYRALGRAVPANITGRIEEVAALRTQYSENRVKALGDSKLPEAKSTDSSRLAVARQILANPEYEFGEHGPVVLTTAEVVTKEKEVSRDTIKDVDFSLSGTVTLSGTRETWNYKWDEFKFATPIKHDDGNWYVWWITAKKYASGWERTPIGTWISGRATQGSLILESNF